MTFVEEKLNFTENALKSQIATEKFPIEKTEFIYCGYKSGTTPPDKAAAWQDFKNVDVDLGYDGHCWVHFTAEVPECSEFERTFLCLDVKVYKGIWDATNPQFLVYVDGEAEQAFDTHHHNLLIGSGSKDIYVYCYSGMEYDDDKWKLNLKFSIQKFNRKSEFLYMDTETAGVMAELLTGKEYPVKELNDGWYIINLNQFHDIIPGSSVEPVYEVSHKQYREITEMGEKLISERLSALKENIETDGGYFVYNPTSFEFSGVTTCGKEEIFVKNIPAHGYAVVKANNYENSFLKAENGVIENDKLKVTFDEKFNIISILDKENEREVIKSGEKANSLEIFEDHPHDFDAWDIDEPYKQKKWIIDDVFSAEFFKNALSCGVKIKRKYNKSVIEQNIILKEGSNRLDFETAVDWKESHILLKTAFPFDINAMNAEYEIQYGHLSRPNHTNTSWDEAKFEVCAQKWADLSDNNYGVALINDCKYGYSTEENVMKLTLLRAPKYPNKNADIGTHRFSYSIFPHTGKDVDGGVIKESFFFNNPVKVSKIEKQSGKLPSSFCFAKTDKEAVVIDAVKKAEDQNGVIIRAYDSFGSKTKCKFEFGKEIKKVYLCDMLENNLKEIEVKDNSFTDIFETFGINTYRIIF